MERIYRESPKRGYKSSKGKKKIPSKTLTEQQHKKYIPETDFDTLKKHLDEMRELKKQANESLLPKIKPKAQDNFDSFMRSKLLNKKILTRRDITLNRIIMKNIIKDHFGNDNEVINNLKLDF